MKGGHTAPLCELEKGRHGGGNQEYRETGIQEYNKRYTSMQVYMIYKYGNKGRARGDDGQARGPAPT